MTAHDLRVGVLLEQLLAPVPGGTGRYSAELAAGLVRTAGTGDSVTGWVAWHRDLQAAAIGGVGPPRRLTLPRRPLALAYARGIGPAPRHADVVHAPTPLLPPSRVPVVVTIHDAVPWTHPETLTPRGARWHRVMAERAVRTGAMITVPSQAVATELARRLPGVAPTGIRVLGAGVAAALTDEPDPDRADDVARRLGLPDEYVVCVATLEPRKGLDVLAEALGILGELAPTALVVGQPGWGGVDLDEVGRRAGVPQGRLRALGRLDDASLGVVLRRATVLVAPSRAEGFDLPVAEAMALGTPVICSDIPVHREVADGAAVLVADGDADMLAAAITGMFGDDELRAKLAANGLRRSADFDWDEVARRAWSLYRELAGAR